MIKRDIDDIRIFYDAKVRINIDNEINYDYKSESYTLKQCKSKSIYFI